MWFDDDNMIFNPFMIGQPEDSKRNDYKQPTYVTYPPYATWPTSKSVSRSTVIAKEENEEKTRKSSQSQLGEMAFSKAIKEEMAAAKNFSADEQRAYAGGASKTDFSEPSIGSGTVRTLMAVRSPRSPSQTSIPKSISRFKAGDKQSSKLSMRSNLTDSNVTLRVPKAPNNTDVDTDIYNDTSLRSLRSRGREISGDETKQRSVRSFVSERKLAGLKSSQASHIKLSHTTDTDSHVSIRSKTTENVTRSSQSGNEKNTDIKSKKDGDSRQSLKEVAESIQKELAKSMETTKSLSIKAAELSERLKAGNEFNHKRFHTLARQYTQTEPMKKCRDDRMSYWFNNAVLS